ncbi:hypothetical protein HP456_00410 [Bacillus haikouensis]|uniref:hypothetical protein n=1 Tax=Bacillus haikouensis TaxID=1510468 RepID=UPI0015575F5F|nr:hypothetical protein [Bacillus haikouensis]NQD64383.1 hypothetical protein [Bacillus haikouensis]
MSIVFLVIVIIMFCLYFIFKYKQKAIQVMTLESFINTRYLEDERQKKNLIETINDIFHGEGNDGGSDGFAGYHHDGGE